VIDDPPPLKPAGIQTVPGAYRPGRHRKPGHVARQLRERRENYGSRWQRDPQREIALLILFAVCLVTVGIAATTAKTGSFEALTRGPDDTFWMESAQRFRYVQMVADGAEIPQVDTHLQTPEGYPPFADTVVQEWFYGKLARRFAQEDESLAAFVRRTTRTVSASAVVPMALLAFAITRRRDAALFAAFLFALCLPVAERGSGAVIFREDLAYPMLLWHLGFLGLWARRPSILRAVAAGALLLVSLLLWKVVTFYCLLLVAFLVTVFLTRRIEPREVALGTMGIFAPPALGVLLPLSLAHDHFATSTPMVVAVALVVVALLAWRVERIPWAGVGLALLVLIGVGRLLLPGQSGYDHAWETILAKIQTLDQKPLDPSGLSFHARHYWTGNYESPSLRRLARDWPWFGLLAVPGLIAVAFELRGRLVDAMLRPPPTKLLEGDGPLDPLPPGLAWFAFWLVGAFLAVYLLFSKLALFAATALAVLAALGFAAPVRLRRVRRFLMVLLALGVALHGLRAVPSLEGFLFTDGEDEGWSPTVVFTSESFGEMTGWMSENTVAGESVLASFIISPFLSTYVNRPTVLHCFFEGDLLSRLERVIGARFGSEDELWEAARAYEARWYIHEPHHLLRTDPRMAQRYVADEMAWPEDSVLARMQYAPEDLKHFELAWENDWFRVFRVLGPDEKAGAPRRSSSAPIWSRALFTGLFGDPLEVLGPPPPELEPADILYSTLRGQAWMRYAEGWRNDTAPLLRFAEQEYGLQKAVEVAPYLVDAHEALSVLYRAAEKPEWSAEHRRRAAIAGAALAGRAPISKALTPVPVPRLP
jgi:hypothetical protein